MQTIGDLIDLFGGNAKFAAIIGKGPSTASEMRRRGSIPVAYWPTIVAEAASRGITGINHDLLVRLHVQKGEAAA